MDFPSVIIGAFVVALATTLGSAFVFAFKRIGGDLYATIMGFCAGMMAYATVEMLNESHALAGHRTAFISFLVGLTVFSALNRLLPHAHGVLVGTPMSRSKRKAVLLVGTMMLHTNYPSVIEY